MNSICKIVVKTTVKELRCSQWFLLLRSFSVQNFTLFGISRKKLVEIQSVNNAILTNCFGSGNSNKLTIRQFYRGYTTYYGLSRLHRPRLLFLINFLYPVLHMFRGFIIWDSWLRWGRRRGSFGNMVNFRGSYRTIWGRRGDGNLEPGTIRAFWAPFRHVFLHLLSLQVSPS